jgi:hypothetical protein
MNEGEAHPVFAISALFLAIGKYYFSQGADPRLFESKITAIKATIL